MCVQCMELQHNHLKNQQCKACELVKQFIHGESKEQRKKRKQLEKSKNQTVVTSIVAPITLETGTADNATKKVAFVLGNGVSRADINPADLKRYGVIYGCNALFRSYAPDHLIAVDTKMIREITQDGYHNTHSVWTNASKYTREIPNLNLFTPTLGWSSGPSALNLASNHGYDTIYILGFDYVGVGKNNELVNNMYAGTHNYKQISERATYFGNWQRQTATCIKNTKVKYIRVIDTQSSYVPEPLIGLTNLTHFTVENFKNRFNIM